MKKYLDAPIWSMANSSTLLTVGALALTLVGCSRKEPEAESKVSEAVAALNTNPQTTNFAIYAQNSAALRDRTAVTGGDVGVLLAGGGALLVPGYELAMTTDIVVDATRSVMANRLLIQDRTRLGDIQVGQVTNQNGSFSRKFSFPGNMPALPPLAAVTPGSTPVTIPGSTTLVGNPGSLGVVSVGYRGIWRLRGGVYHVASLQLDNEARIEALAPVQIRIAGRFAAFDRVWIGSASGVTLNAGDIRIEVSGRNGASGSLSDTPKAAAFGNDTTMRGVMLVPQGTLQFGQRAVLTGAYIGKDVLVDIDARITYQNGVGPSSCLQSCDDGNPCTTDSCSVGTCVHASTAAGTACADGNLCNGGETCDGAGHCRVGTPVVCTALDQCHSVGVCDPATGACSNPNKEDGTSCNDDNVCSTFDSCQGGSCVGGPALICDDGNLCTDDSCVPATGCVHANNTESCNDGNACTTNDKCSGGSCMGGVPPNCDDGNPCTDDSCMSADGCTHTNNSEPCNDGNACTLGDSCQAGSCAPGLAKNCNGDQCNTAGTCDPATGSCSTTPLSGIACSDGDACTQGDMCQAGTCVPGPNEPPLLYRGPGPCEQLACVPATGWDFVPLPQGTSCDDGNVCTSDQCNGNGTCVSELNDRCSPNIPGGIRRGRIEAESYDEGQVITKNDTSISNLDSGDWVLFRGVDFGSAGSVNRIRIHATTVTDNQHIYLHLDAADGPVLADLATLPSGGAWLDQSSPLTSSPSGLHNLYLTFDGTDVAGLDWLEFYLTAVAGTKPYTPPFDVHDNPVLSRELQTSDFTQAPAGHEESPAPVVSFLRREAYVLQAGKTVGVGFQLSADVQLEAEVDWVGSSAQIQTYLLSADGQTTYSTGLPAWQSKQAGSVFIGYKTGEPMQVKFRVKNSGTGPATISVNLSLANP